MCFILYLLLHWLCRLVRTAENYLGAHRSDFTHKVVVPETGVAVFKLHEDLCSVHRLALECVKVVLALGALRDVSLLGIDIGVEGVTSGLLTSRGQETVGDVLVVEISRELGHFHLRDYYACASNLT